MGSELIKDNCFNYKDIKALLDAEAARINNIDFIKDDPVQFPRRFSRQEDIEIVALISAMIAWGNRKMICNNIEKILTIMNQEPFYYVMNEEYEKLDGEKNLHRTFFARHLQYFLRGMKYIYKKYGNLDNFAILQKVNEDTLPAWKLVSDLQKIMKDQNNGDNCSRCLPTNLDQTALKRINMALRWLVRDDGIVDIGLWQSISKDRLFIPLDVHVGNVSRDLGLLKRKANDKKSVIELTSILKEFNPTDPVLYDFALFGIGIEEKNRKI